MDAFCVSMHDPVIWITKALEAAGRGLSDLPIYDPQPPEDVRAFIADWIRENRLARPTEYSAIVVHRHFEIMVHTEFRRSWLPTFLP